MDVERAGELQQLPNAARFGVGDPMVEDDAGGDIARLLPDLGEVFLEVVGDRQRLIELESLLQPLAFVALRVEAAECFTRSSRRSGANGSRLSIGTAWPKAATQWRAQGLWHHSSRATPPRFLHSLSITR